MIKTLLVAERGEIARRIIRTARSAGIVCVAVHTHADASAAHVRDADESALIGAEPSAYADGAAIIAAAGAAGADAVHPGAGPLAASADFADACGQADLAVIGAPASALKLLASPSTTRRVLEQADLTVAHEEKAAERRLRVQLVFGRQGEVASLYERDVSLHDAAGPFLAEAPAPGVSDTLRQTLTAAAVKAASAFGLIGAVSVEFALRADSVGEDLAVTRVIPHLTPDDIASEMATRQDLAALQLAVAEAEALPEQSAIKLTGAGFAARLSATGEAPIERLEIGAPRFGVDAVRLRWEGDAEPGDSLQSDARLGTLAAWGVDRLSAANGLAAALRDTKVAPVRANAGALARCLVGPDVQAGQLTKARTAAWAEPGPDDAWRRGALVALARYARRRADAGRAPKDPWTALDGWRLNAPARIVEHVDLDGAEVEVGLRFPNDPNGLRDGWTAVVITVGGAEKDVEAYVRGLDRPTLRDDAGEHSAFIVSAGDGLSVFYMGDYTLAREPAPEHEKSGETDSAAAVREKTALWGR